MTALIIIVCIVLGIGLGFLINAGLVWVLCWALNAVGIHTLFGWDVKFSWPLVVVFTILYIIFGGCFAGTRNN